MSAPQKFEPGQTVIITGEPGRPTRGRSEGVVESVGRILVKVTEGARTVKFRRDTGWQDGQYRHRRVWTPEGLADHERGIELADQLRCRHIETSMAHLSTDQLAAILAIVDGGDCAVVDGAVHQIVEIIDAGWRDTGHDYDTGLRMGGTPGVRPARTEPVYRLAPLAARTPGSDQ